MHHFSGIFNRIASSPFASGSVQLSSVVSKSSQLYLDPALPVNPSQARIKLQFVRMESATAAATLPAITQEATAETEDVELKSPTSEATSPAITQVETDVTKVSELKINSVFKFWLFASTGEILYYSGGQNTKIKILYLRIPNVPI